jgi:hypothetical protein
VLKILSDTLALATACDLPDDYLAARERKTQEELDKYILRPLRQRHSDSGTQTVDFLKAEAQSRAQEREAMAKGDAMFHARMALHFGGRPSSPLDVCRMVQ